MAAAPSRRRFRTLRWLVVTLAMTLLLAACQTTASSSPTSGGGDGADITLTGSAFDPETITVSVGDPVSIENEGGSQHEIVEGEDGSEVDDPAFEAVSLASGEGSEITFDEPGTYNLTCTIHPSMNMVVTVE